MPPAARFRGVSDSSHCRPSKSGARTSAALKMSKGNELKVSGLSQDITEEAIRFVFSTFGKVVQVVLTEKSRNTGAQRIAYISFSKRLFCLI